jgi:hypothetical protein
MYHWPSPESSSSKKKCLASTPTWISKVYCQTCVSLLYVPTEILEYIEGQKIHSTSSREEQPTLLFEVGTVIVAVLSDIYQ